MPWPRWLCPGSASGDRRAAPSGDRRVAMLDGQARSKPGVRCYQLAEYVTGVEMRPPMSQFTPKLVPFHYSVPLPMHVQKTGTEPFTI